MQNPTLLDLSFLLLPLLFVGVIYARWVGERFELLYATLRMLIQLVAVGYALIFIFAYDALWLGAMVVFFMLWVSVSIVFRNTLDKSVRNFSLIFAAILFSSVVNLGLIVSVVLQLDPFYQPRYSIPLMGMILSQSMNGVALALERFERESEGGSGYLTARNAALKVSLMPQINALLAVGLVALPGMMTGQILSGVAPLIAVRYQIMIMMVSVSGVGMSVIFYFLLRRRWCGVGKL